MNSSDLTLITYGKIINDDDQLDYIKNQVFLVKINIKSYFVRVETKNK